MLNHFHGIFAIDSEVICAADDASTSYIENHMLNNPVSLSQDIRTFKSLTAIEANKILNRNSTPFWQRNYYERVIRDEYELDKMRKYIVENPL